MNDMKANLKDPVAQRDTLLMLFVSALLAVAITFGLGGFSSQVLGAPGGGNSQDTPADIIHPDIHSKVGQGDGTNANPNGVNANGGNIHGIGNVPGQNADSEPGVANLANVHGGIAEVNKNVG